MKGKDKKVVTVYLPKGLYAEIRQAAQKDRHSMSTQVVMILEEVLRETVRA